MHDDLFEFTHIVDVLQKELDLGGVVAGVGAGARQLFQVLTTVIGTGAIVDTHIELQLVTDAEDFAPLPNQCEDITSIDLHWRGLRTFDHQSVARRAQN